eukprot:GHVU01199851.1.p1 GENE.GHVU01199851.1~~GHVU01199851.1.p1  ORF type:complete len:114 (+),score=12.93 GHVU01199851.1:86-427(+)
MAASPHWDCELNDSFLLMLEREVAEEEQEGNSEERSEGGDATSGMLSSSTVAPKLHLGVALLTAREPLREEAASPAVRRSVRPNAGHLAPGFQSARDPGRRLIRNQSPSQPAK